MTSLSYDTPSKALTLFEILKYTVPYMSLLIVPSNAGFEVTIDYDISHRKTGQKSFKKVMLLPMNISEVDFTSQINEAMNELYKNS